MGKGILSANPEAGCNVECLMEDEDLSAKVERSLFEDLCSHMVPILESSIQKVLATAEVTPADLKATEIVGAGSRTPWVKKTTLNADECVARGCALQAAQLSPLFKVRPFAVHDVATYPVAITWLCSNHEGRAARARGVRGGVEGE